MLRGSAPIITKTAAAEDLFTLAGPDVFERQGFQAALAVAAGNSGAEPDSDVGGRLPLGDEVSDMLAASDSPRASSMIPDGEIGQVQGGLTG